VTSAGPDSLLILGIDGGNSKVDLALTDGAGELLGAERGPTISHQAVGIDAGMTRLRELAHKLVADGIGDRSLPADLCVASLAGADYPEDVRLLRAGIGALKIAREVIVVNDTFGALRAGTTSGWGVGLVCGQGINAGAIAPDGRQARFPGVGDIAGDWGGGGGISMAALQAAVRGSDGRGPRTSLEKSVPAFFGVRTPAAMTRAFYLERIPHHEIPRLAPLVFSEAEAGDAVAGSIIDRLADELAAMAAALIRKLHMARLEVEVVLAGGVFRTGDVGFYARLDEGIKRVAPRARTVRLGAPPVAGALLLAMDELARRGMVAPPDQRTSERIRVALRTWDSRLVEG
jgi:N-acetylglucosamine kinase-like BadF-type ATPase